MRFAILVPKTHLPYTQCVKIWIAAIGARPREGFDELARLYLVGAGNVEPTQMTSETFARWLGRERDEGRQLIVFAIGPADGWSEDSRKRAAQLLSLGPMTMAHELARVVLAEQIYRALTILSGHPYHRAGSL